MNTTYRTEGRKIPSNVLSSAKPSSRGAKADIDPFSNGFNLDFMATAFKRVQAALDAAHGDFTKISDESLGLDDRIAALRALQAVFKEHDGEVARMAVRAAETDPDRKVNCPSFC
jgi:acyl-CoA reductase-like NAD-dependent aldehyde dehydrogenase